MFDNAKHRKGHCMDKFTIQFEPMGISCQAVRGTTLLAAMIDAGLTPDAPCGGKGTCGKCKVEIIQAKKTATGEVLACQTEIQEDMTVDTRLDPKNERILSKGAVRHVPLDPYPTAAHHPGAPHYAVAFDIGTTTVVGYLLKDGVQLAVKSTMNPQIKFGADVISRANYVLENGAAGQDALSGAVRGAVDGIVGQLCDENGIPRDAIELVSVVGNTCMHHLYLGLMPDTLVVSPYMPRVREAGVLDPAAYGLHINPNGKLLWFPNIAGFVGGDTVACLVATDFDQIEPLTLLIDIGTNGEIVLGNKDRRIACSTAAGPAFEGAKIACGMRGATGAVDHVRFENNALVLSVIGGGAPEGICGSGLMDLIAALIGNGFIEDSGRLLNPDEVETPCAKANANRLVRIDNQPAFVLAFEQESGTGERIYLSQKDVREVQLAKAAIAAGIHLMAEELGHKVEDIQSVLIAGAFGNYMDPKSACAIGLIPPMLLDRITPIGNAAGEGSKLAAISVAEFEHAKALAVTTEFLELANKAEFQDCFVDELEFNVEG